MEEKRKPIRWWPITDEEKANEAAVRAARPPEVNEALDAQKAKKGAKRGKPDYLKDPHKVKRYYEVQAELGLDPRTPRTPREAALKGGQTRSKQLKAMREEQTRLAKERIEKRLAEQLAERQMRMDEIEATLPTDVVITPYLPKDLQEKLGIFINPLYEMQKLLLSDTLPTKEKALLLSKLSEFTHEKAVSKTTVTVTRPESFLEALAQDEKVIDGSAEVVEDSEEAGD